MPYKLRNICATTLLFKEKLERQEHCQPRSQHTRANHRDECTFCGSTTRFIVVVVAIDIAIVVAVAIAAIVFDRDRCIALYNFTVWSLK